MGLFFVDDSLHPTHEYIVCAVVYSESDPSSSVFQAIENLGLTPCRDEYKSGIQMSRNPEQRELRDALFELLRKTRIGILIAPHFERGKLGSYILEALRKIIEANELASARHTLIVDAGIECPRPNIRAFSALYPHIDVQFGQDSKLVGGLQLADLAAHSLSVLINYRLTGKNKMIRYSEEYDGKTFDREIDLVFHVWLQLRRCFFRAQHSDISPLDDPISGATLNVQDYGLFVSMNCPERVREAAYAEFDAVYLGCTQ